MTQINHRSALLAAPEICIEVLSPSNTREEMPEIKHLYFQAGAQEVWFCGRTGEINFYLSAKPTTAKKHSAICPKMPSHLPEE
jgi:Uma2 family endonuclease